MTEWTRDMVEKRVLEAAGVLRKLPGPRVQGYFSAWPDVLLSAREIARQEPKPMKVLPSPQAISRMEAILTWNRFIEPDEAHLMWARAEGTPWKGICYRFGISRPTAHRRSKAQGVHSHRCQDGPHGPCDRQGRRTLSSLLRRDDARREDPSLMRP